MYRRRRVVVGLALLAVVVVIVLLIVRPGSAADDTKGPGGTQSPSGEPTDADTPAADGSTACDPAQITLTPVTDRTEYQAGENPMISMTIVNSGTSPCTFNVGTDAQLYSIVSGSDPIWNSADCQTDATPMEQVLQPGVELTTTPFAWDRTRSSPETCNSDRDPVVAGGATYRLSVSLGDAESADDVAFLLY
ncbi:hypothetical protein D7I47_04850 [Protaetiibacter intestinalis]|uniref:DUF4232 domain-containing protein n=1 Tax=Protaetiibacter intestinalis TaxID=2419774 RepID=A0A387B5H1_9MICO|nr:hypothetical protein D7I47_04850 [Protaetiibacter intestinalis]